jgi:hypothetical protein
VRLSAGQTRADLSLPVVDRGTASLRVCVTDAATGEPVADARVDVVNRDTFLDAFAGRTDAEGVFCTDMVYAGPFQVTVSADAQGYVRWSKWVDIAAEGDVAEVAFQMGKGAVLAGRIVTEDGSDAPPLPHFWAYAVAEMPETIDGHPRRVGDVQTAYMVVAEGPQRERFRPDDGGRIVSPPVAPGKVHIVGDTSDPEWRLLRMSVGGKPLQAGGEIECKAGQHIDDLQIVVGTNLSVIAGRIVSVDAKEPLPDAWAHLSRRDGEVFSARPIPTDRSGSFLFHAVPAGPYLLAPAASLDGPTLEAGRREIDLEPGQVVHVDLIMPDDRPTP